MLLQSFHFAFFPFFLRRLYRGQLTHEFTWANLSRLYIHLLSGVFWWPYPSEHLLWFIFSWASLDCISFPFDYSKVAIDRVFLVSLGHRLFALFFSSTAGWTSICREKWNEKCCLTDMEDTHWWVYLSKLQPTKRGGKKKKENDCGYFEIPFKCFDLSSVYRYAATAVASCKRLWLLRDAP